MALGLGVGIGIGFEENHMGFWHETLELSRAGYVGGRPSETERYRYRYRYRRRP